MNIGFFGALGLVFVVLKLTEYIAWSWWLVLAPLYVPPIIFVLFALLLVSLGGKPKVTINKKKD
jgi:hypothetical protein